jgi:hypothetical protein
MAGPATLVGQPKTQKTLYADDALWKSLKFELIAMGLNIFGRVNPGDTEMRDVDSALERGQLVRGQLLSMDGAENFIRIGFSESK